MGLIERPTNDDPRVHRLAQVLARSAWPGDSNRDLRELERHVYALEAQLAGAVERIAELETEVARLARERSNLAKSALAHRQAGREEADAARGQ